MKRTIDRFPRDPTGTLRYVDRGIGIPEIRH